MKIKFNNRPFDYTYFCNSSKALPLDMIDILRVNKREKKALFIKNYVKNDEFYKNSPFFTYHIRLNSYVRKLKNKGYTIEEKDGAEGAIDGKTVGYIIAMQYTPEKLCALIGERIQSGKYFNFKIIEEGINRFLHDEVNGTYLAYWAQLYSNAIKESISTVSKVSTGLIAASKAFEDISIIGRAKMDDEQERKAEIKEYIKIFAELDQVINPETYKKIEANDMSLLDSFYKSKKTK